VCDIMSASSEPKWLHTVYSRATAICHRLCYRITRARGQRPSGPRKTRRRNTLQKCGAFSETFTFFDFCRSFRRHSKTRVCILPGIYVSKDTRSIQHHFDDLANGARFKKRHCWGVRIWFDQPRKER
jgi:hypothetical protein